MLKITFSTSVPKTAPVHVVLTGQEKKLSATAAALDKTSSGALSASLKAADFTGKLKKHHMFHSGKTGAVLVMGIGKAAELKPDSFEKAGSEIYKAIPKHVKKAVIELDTYKGHVQEEAAALIGFGALLNSYRFDKYKTKQKPDDLPKLEEITIVVRDAAAAKKAFAPLEKIADGVFLTRDLVWEPANELYPESFAKRIKKELSPLGVKIKILNEAQMKKLGMGSLLSVGHGSARESQLVIMEWNGAPKSSKKAPVAFVGKGITFDTGGISLKPGAGMWDMKWDMGGAGAVVGAMKAIAGRKAKANVVAAVALAENMPSDRATRPGDVVTSMSGQTIEILNTDAEGRLVLADALTYVQQKHKPEVIIDLATLTGAIIVALGHEFAGAFTNEDSIAKALITAGAATGDHVWHMPMADAWNKALDSDVSDVRNISLTRDGGSGVAAAFLKRFIEDGQKWLHLDIAGMAWAAKASDGRPKGATGYGVRLLDKYIADTAE